MGALRVALNPRLAREIARRLQGVTPRAPHFLPRPPSPGGEARLADFYFAWVGICQQTRSLRGVVAGRPLRGSDYLAHRLCAVLDADPTAFSAERLAALGPDDLRGWLAEDGNPASSTADRVDERTWLLNDLGVKLIDGYEGSAAGVLAASKGRLGGRTGLLARLSRFAAYRDPVRKKSYLLVHFLRGLGLFEPVDPGRLGLPVDYHILRVFLRAGVLALGGVRAESLRRGGPMAGIEDVALRRAAVRAGAVMAEIVPLDRLDLLLWMTGRNCCFYDHEPICRTGPCVLADGCSFLAASDLRCGLRCPLDGLCQGSRDPAQAAIREPSIDTDLY